VPKFAANLSFIFQEVGFLDRFAAAAACGFKAVEYLSPYEHPPEVIAAQLNRHGLEQALFNMPPGDWAAGERGTAALPGREQEFRDGVEQALVYAKATNCRLLHAMGGVLPSGHERATAERVYIANLQYAAERLAREGISVVIEPINTRDIPGYFLNTTTQAMSIMERVGHPMCRSWRAISRSASARLPAITRMCRSPATPAGTSRMSARSTIPSCSICSTRSAIPAGSVANTARAERPEPGSAGPGATASAAERCASSSPAGAASSVDGWH